MQNNSNSSYSFSYRNYFYVCEEDASGFGIITTHHISLKRSWKHRFLQLMILVTVSGLLSVLVTSCFISNAWNLIASCLLSILLVASLYRSGIKKETVVVMPTFGVQLERHYNSGKVVRCFVPMGDILAAVINEAVTPFTCYSYLALILRDQERLALVFQRLRPPLQMLIPTWKSLCKAIDNKMVPSKQERLA